MLLALEDTHVTTTRGLGVGVLPYIHIYIYTEKHVIHTHVNHMYMYINACIPGVQKIEHDSCSLRNNHLMTSICPIFKISGWTRFSFLSGKICFFGYRIDIAYHWYHWWNLHEKHWLDRYPSMMSMMSMMSMIPYDLSCPVSAIHALHKRGDFSREVWWNCLWSSTKLILGYWLGFIAVITIILNIGYIVFHRPHPVFTSILYVHVWEMLCTFQRCCACFPAVAYVSQKLCTFHKPAIMSLFKCIGATKHVLP